MLDPGAGSPARFRGDIEPLLIVVVDTEEEFDWSKPFSRSETAVTAMRAQEKAHRIFEKYSIRPTYLIDYPVASQPEGYHPLKDFLADDLCTMGAHLHPWVNPPFLEEVNRRNSYPGNLEPELELDKLRYLAKAIEDNLEVQPTIYKAGRYGVGANTGQALSACNFEIDMSVVPTWNYRHDHGPDFRGHNAHPYWFGRDRKLLEIPMTCGFAGALAALGPKLFETLSGQLGMKAHVPGIFARLGLLERIRLTPEGVTYSENKRLTEALYASGHRVFAFSYHSPSLAIGHTPYVQTEADLACFLERLERYIDYFVGELGGRPATPHEVRDMLKPPPNEGPSVDE